MKKIMFSERYGLQQSVLDGSKTMTRRVITQIEDLDEVGVWPAPYVTIIRNGRKVTDIFPAYQVGEEVAVAESYRTILNKGESSHIDLCQRIIKEYNLETKSPHNWAAMRFAIDKLKGNRNKMFVKADLMPHRIRITGIKVERLQDISEEDAMREGIFHYEQPPLYHECDRFAPWPPYVKPYKHDNDNLKYRATARYAFAYLIDKVSGSGTWKSNPYVFAYEFELLNPET